MLGGARRLRRKKLAKFLPLFAAAGPGELPAVLDRFTDADGASLDAHAPERCPPGARWVEQRGNWLIVGEQAGIAAGFGGAHATLECGLADCTASVETNANSEGAGTLRDCGLYLRYANADNAWRLGLNSIANVFRLTERNAAAETVRASTAFIPSGLHRIEARLQGATISGTVDGGNGIAYASAALNRTCTVHGLYDGASAGRKDNFTVEAL